MKRIVMWLIAGVLILVTTEVARRLGGNGAAGLVLMIAAVSIGTTIGVNWGNRQSAETEKYRKALITGQKMPAANDPLNPSPKDIASLIEAAVFQPWPATESDRWAYFSRLKLVNRDDLATEHPKVGSGLLVAPSLGAAEGMWASLEDRLLSVTMYFYTDPRLGPSAAVLGYNAVREELIAVLGSPAEEHSEHFGEPTSFWTVGDIFIGMSCQNRRVDSLEIEINHGARAEEYEALLCEEPDQQ